MFNVCPGCGAYVVEREIDAARSLAVCPRCGHEQPFRRLPLYVVTGASGSGKSTVCLALAQRASRYVPLEMDILWGPAFDTPADNYQAFRDVWLRLAKNVAQAGRPVALFGTATPEQFERSPERRYFAAIHYLALTCEDSVLAARLRARPAWRQSGQEPFLERMLDFNRWLREHAATTVPPMTLLDTTDLSIEQARDRVAAWIDAQLPDDPSETTLA